MFFTSSKDYNCRCKGRRDIRLPSAAAHCWDCGFKSRRWHRYLSLRVSVMCSQVVVTSLGRSLVQRSPIECGVSECDTKTSRMRRCRPTTAVKPWKKKKGLRKLIFSSTISTIPGDHCFSTQRKKLAFHVVASCNISTFVVLLRVRVFWDAGPCRLVNIYRR